MDLYQWTRVSGTAAGTTLVSARSGVLNSIVIPAAKEGTVTLYDSSTAAGTTSTNHIISFSNNLNAAKIPASLPVDIRFKKGLVAVVGGTTDVTVTWC